MTNIAYPESPLNCFEAKSSLLGRLNPFSEHYAMPGERAPDSSVTLSSREKSTLQQLFLGTNFTALVFDTEAAGISAEALELVAEVVSPLVSPIIITSSEGAMDSYAQEGNVIVVWDERGAARSHYGIDRATSAVVLVRPDGHIGMVSQPACNDHHLAAYLTGV